MKTYFYPVAAILVLALTQCTPADTTEETETNTAATPTLTKLWETDTTLITPESVLFDAQNEVFYVSCIGNVPPSEKDGDGYIAIIDADGNITNPRWVTGLSAPKGMALIKGVLYVTDISRIVMIDTKSGKITGEREIEGATFLNDLAAAADGTVYFSDSETNKVYSLKEDKLTELFTDSVTLAKPNGVFVADSKLMVVGMNSGNLVSYGISDKSSTTVADSLFGGDGVEKYKSGYFISNWNGEVFYLTNDWQRSQVLDTKNEKLNAADICVAESKNLLLVPTFFGNTVAAYKIEQAK